MIRLLPLTKIVFWTGLLASGFVQALDYRSVAETGTILYAAPSSGSTKLFIASEHLPVEVVLIEKGWVRVRDATGQMAWVPHAKLSNKRFVVVTKPSAVVRQSPADGAAALLIAEKDVALELLEPPSSGWLKVRHDGKTEGFISLRDVWGI